MTGVDADRLLLALLSDQQDDGVVDDVVAVSVELDAECSGRDTAEDPSEQVASTSPRFGIDFPSTNAAAW